MFAFNVNDQRIRPDPKIEVGNPERVENDNEVVIVDETSNPESPSASSSDASAGPSGETQAVDGGSVSRFMSAAAAAAAASGQGVQPSLLTRLFMACPVSATPSPNASPMVSPVASPQPRATWSPPSSSNAQVQAAVTTSGSNDLRVLRTGNSFVFPSSDGGSLLVQRLVEPQQLPPSPRLPTSYVTQHPLKPFSTPRTDPTVPPGHKEHGFNLVGNKYLLLDQLEGSHLQRCINVQTQKEYVCKVRAIILIFFQSRNNFGKTQHRQRFIIYEQKKSFSTITATSCEKEYSVEGYILTHICTML